MHRLSDAVIIIDEVQSIPLKCVYLFNLAMNFLSQVCGSTIVLCSATQPPFELLNEFPMILDKKDSMTGETTDDFNAFRRTELIYQEKNGGFSYDETADFCRDRFQKHGSLLVVVNTKSSANSPSPFSKSRTAIKLCGLKKPVPTQLPSLSNTRTRLPGSMEVSKPSISLEKIQ